MRNSIVGIGSAAGACARRVWRALRTITGDDAYERYLHHVASKHAGTTPLSPAAFYRAELDRRWSAPNRCC